MNESKWVSLDREDLALIFHDDEWSFEIRDIFWRASSHSGEIMAHITVKAMPSPEIWRGAGLYLGDTVAATLQVWPYRVEVLDVHL